MTQPARQLKTRHYHRVAALAREEDQVLSEAGMHRRCVATSLMEEFRMVPEHPCLVPSADGALEAVAFTIPAYAVRWQDNPLWKIYTDLILKLPEYTSLYLLLHESAKEPVVQWLEAQNLMPRVNLQTLPDTIEMTVWAEDAFAMVHDRGELFVVQQHTYRRPGDELASYYASQRFGWKRAKVPLYFEGGNILVGDNFFFLGTDYAVDTFFDLGELLEQNSNLSVKKVLAQHYQRYLDKSRALFYISTSLQLPDEQTRSFLRNGEEWQEKLYLKNKEGAVQPIFHIDMFITLAGRNEAGKYQVLVGDPRLASELLGNDHYLLATPEAFDDVAALLSKLDFEVIRNPLPLTYVDDEEEKLRKWFFATYNNALVEVKNRKDKTVWLPSYGYGN